ncbi:MAG: carboxypeptidase-like regulatory domain-containing protein [Sphingobacteriaceae bacterium]|nr:MAG: carboxypeptidase-like regulatory domain-containing protein [Sphingobacteriaceae bacterium]
MKRLLLIACFFATLTLLTVSVRAQSVKGKVIDATTGNPIANASIHLNGSSKGTTSNKQGEFALYTDETKKPLIVSYIGYQSDTIANYNGKTLTVKLNPRDQVLRVVVIGESMTRDKQMKIFITQFIGSNSKDCIIINPDDINFTYNKKTKTLKATVNRPLIIRNRKLGYKITYFLSAFSYSPQPTLYPWETSYHMQTSYKGNYVFEEDTLFLKPAEMNKIRKARDKAYYGSRMHFIRLVLTRWYDWANWGKYPEKNKFVFGYNNLNFKYDDGVRLNFVFNNIRANKEKLLNSIIIHNDGRYFSGRPGGGITYGLDFSEVTFQSGEITLNRVADELVLTPVSYNDSDLIWSGKMGEQRVIELLPYDFEPSKTYD